MLKIRIQGTINDIQWFKKMLDKHPEVQILQVSKAFSNKGTDKYFRAYAEIEKEEK